MNTAARRSPMVSDRPQRGEVGEIEGSSGERGVAREQKPAAAGAAPRVYVAAENRLLREALSRMLVRQGDVQVVGLNSAGPFRVEDVVAENPEILLLTSRGSVGEDIRMIRQVRVMAPSVRIVLVGITESEAHFFQYVSAGIRGYLPRDASWEDVLEAMRAVHAGHAACPGSLCGVLFRYFEKEATSLHSRALQPRLGLTRREQQIVPLIAQGMTNKEIASHFCLSEQTVKNHLYRMKHKIGAADRFGIVHLCRTQGFMA